MITSIFNKSKALNFFIVFIIVVLAFVLAAFRLEVLEFTTQNALLIFALFSIVYFTLLVVNFIVYKNHLSHRNNYELLVFGFLLLAVPQSVTDINVVISNLFIVLALRRLLSLKSLKNVTKKLFDAGFLIVVATFFYFWSILFLVLAILSPLFFSEYRLKSIIAPILGFLSVFVIMLATSIVVTDTYLGLYDIQPFINFNYSNYSSLVIVLSFLGLLGVRVVSFFIKQIRLQIKAVRPNYKIVFYGFLISLVVVVIAYPKTGAELLFLFPFMAIMITNYIEELEYGWMQEVILWSMLLISLGVFLF